MGLPNYLPLDWDNDKKKKKIKPNGTGGHIMGTLWQLDEEFNDSLKK